MKIVLDARELRTSTGRYVERLLHHLQQIDDEHDYVVLLKPEDYKGWQPTNPRFSKVKTPYKEFTFGEQLGFLRQVRSLNADLVHFGMTQQPVFYQGKTVTTVHDLTTTRFRNPTKDWLVFWVKQKVYKWVIRRVAKKSDVIITPSFFVKKDLAKFAHIDDRKINVTYEAAEEFNAPAEAIPELEGKQFILFNGRLLPHKNLRRLIEAFNILHVKNPNLLLVIAGKKDVFYEPYGKFVHKLKIEDAVIFTGFIPDGQLKWAFRHCKAYVYPSLSEGFGLPGLEAMHYGAPLVSSSATCLPEIYEDAAHYFDPRKVYDMATKIEEVITNADLRNKLINRGKDQVAKYSWKRMAIQTLKIYNEILNK